MNSIAVNADAAKWDTRFSSLWGYSYKNLLPIIPPDAQVSPSSSYAKAPGALGKAVGVKGADGLWCGLNWTTIKPTEADLKRWARMGAGVGLRMGPIDADDEAAGWTVAIDSDTYDVDLARKVDVIVHEHFGLLPCRIGAQPKALYLIRVSGPVRYTRVGFGGIDPATKRPRHAVELLAGMKQAVMPPSVHPKTRQPYRWARPLVPLNELPQTTPEALAAFFDALRSALPEVVSHSQGSGPVDRARVDQNGLRGDVDKVERAMRALPNTIELFPDYADMIRVGEAVHAATIDDPDRGEEIFLEWAGRWDGFTADNTFSPDFVAAKWRSFQAPHSLGADYLYKQAAKHAPDKFNIAEVWFDDLTEPAAQEDKGAAGAASPQTSGRPLNFLSFKSATDKALAAKARPLVRGLLDCGAMSVVYGQPGAGKSFVMLRLAHCVASGRLFGGMPVAQGAVAYIAGEGGGGIYARLEALRLRFGESDDEGMPIQLHLLAETVNIRNPAADLHPLLDALAQLEKRAGKIALVVVDTLARAMGGGDENSPVDMGHMIANLDKIRAATGAHVAIVHHCGKDESRGMRGHSSLLGAIDSEIEISEGRGVAHKQRDLESGAAFSFSLESVLVGHDADNHPVRTAIAEISACDTRSAEQQSAARLSPLERAILTAFEDQPSEPMGKIEIAAAVSLKSGKPYSAESIRHGIYTLKLRGRIVKDGQKWRLAPDILSGEVAARSPVSASLGPDLALSHFSKPPIPATETG